MNGFLLTYGIVGTFYAVSTLIRVNNKKTYRKLVSECQNDTGGELTALVLALAFFGVGAAWPGMMLYRIIKVR